MWGETYLCKHLLLSELPDGLDGLWGPLLELDSLKSFVHVEGVVTAGWLQVGFLAHLNSFENKNN